MRIALNCGNGLSIDCAKFAALSLHPSRPLSFPTTHPRRGTPLLDSLPSLRAWLTGQPDDDTESDYGRIERLLAAVPPHPGDLPELAAMDNKLLDLPHYVALAYSTYQLQLDRTSMERWQWLRWFKQYNREIVIALSWNYDLVLERVLLRSRIRFFHPGAGGWPEWRGTLGSPVGVAICKPHGSCHFGGDGFEVTNAMTEGGPMEEVDYPRATNVAFADVPQRTLRDEELLTVRPVADIVLPGEFNRFGHHLRWMKRANQYWRHNVATADTLVVVGFSFSEPDRDELADALKWAGTFKRGILVDPQPSTALLDFVRERSDRVEVWQAGPKRL